MAVDAYLRRVKEEDREVLFAWINDETTRRQSFSQGQVTWEEHTAWFARKQADPDCHHFMLIEAKDPEKPAGVLRMERCGERPGSYRISYSIAPSRRGKGLGKKLLALAEKWAYALYADCMELCGEVKTGNEASVRCFEKAGYQREKEDADVIFFCREIRREKTVYFRADANAQVGFGHMMRCLTIAGACEERGLHPVFATADEEAQEMISSRGYPAVTLHTDYRNMEEELREAERVFAGGALIVLDSYFLTQRYVGELRKKGFRLAWLDDLGKDRYTVDLLINYNVYAPKLDYLRRKPEKEGADTVYLLGAAYAPLRPAFSRGRYEVRLAIKMVLITTGASDPYGLGVLFAREMMTILPDAKICAVCGPYAGSTAELHALAAGCDRLEVIEGASDLSRNMYESDLAIAAAGSTLYELCAVGVPTVTYWFADNQRQGAEAFTDLAGMPNLGDMREEKRRGEIGPRLRQITEAMGGVQRRRETSAVMNKITDARGAQRIAEELEKLVLNG